MIRDVRDGSSSIDILKPYLSLRFLLSVHLKNIIQSYIPTAVRLQRRQKAIPPPTTRLSNQEQGPDYSPHLTHP